MSGKKYLTLNEYDGTLSGINSNNFDPQLFPTEGGISAIHNHWTRGLFGRPEQVIDAYAGTGDRYISSPYGNLYIPNSHTNTYDNYRGPSSDITEKTTIHGNPYFWDEKKSSHIQKSNIESFSNVEILEPFDLKTLPSKDSNTKFTPKQNDKKPETHLVPQSTPINFDSPDEDSDSLFTVKIVVIIAILVVCLHLWGETIHTFLKQELTSGKGLPWSRIAMYSIIVSMLAIVSIKMLQIKL
jgi:hypothetical protein